MGPEHVLLVLDIDNTMMAMDHDLGSDQWFEWQHYLFENEPSSTIWWSKSFDGLLEAQGLLYNLATCIRRRGTCRRSSAGCRAAGFARCCSRRAARSSAWPRSASCAATATISRPPRCRCADLPGGSYLPYDLDDLEADGLTQRDVPRSTCTSRKPVSYANGIFMTAGQPKGRCCSRMLNDADADIKAVVYADDNIRHVAYVFAAVAGRGNRNHGFHYTREEPRMQALSIRRQGRCRSALAEVSGRWKKCLNDSEDSCRNAKPAICNRF